MEDSDTSYEQQQLNQRQDPLLLTDVSWQQQQQNSSSLSYSQCKITSLTLVPSFVSVNVSSGSLIGFSLFYCLDTQPISSKFQSLTMVDSISFSNSNEGNVPIIIFLFIVQSFLSLNVKTFHFLL
jgi:hypothetical protein